MLSWLLYVLCVCATVSTIVLPHILTFNASLEVYAPRVFFCVIEQIMVILGLGYIVDLAKHTTALLSYVPAYEIAATEQLAFLELGNMMLLVAGLIAVVMWFSREPKIIHLTVAAMALGDIPHWGAAVWVMGWERFLDFGSWRPALKVQIIGPPVRFAAKVAHLMGWLGRDRVPTVEKRKA